MYRKNYWPVGHYADHIDKYECLECGNEFIVGRKMLEMSGRKKPICPYCGCELTDDQAGTDDERLEELADELGCLGLYFDNEEDQRDWTEKELIKIGQQIKEQKRKLEEAVIKYHAEDKKRMQIVDGLLLEMCQLNKKKKELEHRFCELQEPSSYIIGFF